MLAHISLSFRKQNSAQQQKFLSSI